MDNCYISVIFVLLLRLSVPLLKLRPRSDFVETLLHEMIHAYLFVTDGNDDHDGHGPAFHEHMYRINKEAGTKISVYHNFHDEVGWSLLARLLIARKYFFSSSLSIFFLTVVFF